MVNFMGHSELRINLNVLSRLILTIFLSVWFYCQHFIDELTE